MAKPSLRAKSTKLELVHPTEGKCGWVLDVVGFDSIQVRSKIKEVAAARATKGEAQGITIETLTADQHANAEIAAAAVINWNEEFAEADSSIGVYSKEVALKLMLDEEINWIREQVEACLRQRANFFRDGDQERV
jgi:hypothetical protein